MLTVTLAGGDKRTCYRITGAQGQNAFRIALRPYPPGRRQ